MNFLQENPVIRYFRNKGFGNDPSVQQLAERIGAKPVQPTPEMLEMQERTSQPHNFLSPAIQQAMNRVNPAMYQVANQALHGMDMQGEMADEFGARATDAVSPYVPAPVAGAVGAGANLIVQTLGGPGGAGKAMVGVPKNLDNVDISHRMRHRPAGRDEGNTLDNLSSIYPEDVYSRDGARLYGGGISEGMDEAAAKIIRAVRNKPDAEVAIYRSVPKGVDAKEIMPGDWVSITPEYAIEHGLRWDEGYTLLKRKVKANELTTEGNSLQEWGWNPVSEIE